jgi:hypothetical protein
LEWHSYVGTGSFSTYTHVTVHLWFFDHDGKFTSLSGTT